MNNPFSEERDASMETLHQNANHLKSVSLDWDEVFSPDPLPEPETDAEWCQLHQERMRRNENERGVWYSHYLEDQDRWCKGKGRGK